MSELIFLGTVSYPDDGIRRTENGEFVYYPHLDVNGVHAALLDPMSGYGKPPGMDLRANAENAATREGGGA